MTAHPQTIDGALREFASGLKGATEVEEACKVLAALSARFAMPELMVAKVEPAAGVPPENILFSARSLSGLRAYAAEHPFAENPLMVNTWASDTPCLLSELRSRLELDDEGFWALLPPWTRGKDALVVSVPCISNKRVIFWFGGPPRGVDGELRSALFVASSLAVEHVMELESGTAAPKLTKREVEVLRMLAADKTDGEAAAALGIAVRTVRFHLENAKEKLGVATRAQATLMVLRGELP